MKVRTLLCDPQVSMHIAMVDLRQKWEFRKNVAEFLQTKSTSSERIIRDQLTVWSVNDDQLLLLFKSFPLAK